MAYNGAGFHGWAVQPDRRTVQGVIEEALGRILHGHGEHAEAPRLTVAGRTDAGVHASHQVCHVDVSDQALARCVGHMQVTAVKALETRLSRMMSDDIAIHAVSVAPDGFDARFSALERTYVYRIADAFARNMVRSLVGACVQVGMGKRDVDWFAGKMHVPLREGSTGPIAPQGLTLEHIAYPADGELAARAERIRAKRTL